MFVSTGVVIICFISTGRVIICYGDLAKEPGLINLRYVVD